MEEILKTILYEWQERKLPKVIKRNIRLETKKDTFLRKAKVITGFRRTGKTYLLFSLIQKLLKTYNRTQIIYINFEDERLPLKTEVLSGLLPTIRAVFGKDPAYLFLDELQNIPHWSKWLRRILDQKEISIFATGSSSKMSSFEMPTELRGRSWETKVYPLDFDEFLRFKRKAVNWEKVKHLPDERAKLDFLFNEYLLWGGLPEVVLTPQERKQELLQNYFQTVVRKEIIERFQVKNEEVLKAFLKLLINSTSFSVSKMYNNLKSLSFKVGKTTLNSYLSYIESSYFLKQLFFYSPKMKSQLQYPRKAYFIDNGFLTSLSTKFSKNYGRLFENFVFWHLTKKGKNLFYCKNEKGEEVDFVLMENGKTKALYQVCFNLHDFETYQRETKSLLKAGKKFSCQNLYLIGKKPARKISEKEAKITFIDLAQFLRDKY